MSNMLSRWREDVEWGILSIGRDWDKTGCQCDPSVGAMPCHYCAEHRAIIAAGEMLVEIEKIHPRIWKLIEKKRRFIVIGEHEPYYMGAYELIREQEMKQGTWTEEDQLHFEVVK